MSRLQINAKVIEPYFQTVHYIFVFFVLLLLYLCLNSLFFSKRNISITLIFTSNRLLVTLLKILSASFSFRKIGIIFDIEKYLY